MQKKVCIIQKTPSLDPRSFYKESRSLLKAKYDVCIAGYYRKSAVINGIRIIETEYPHNRLFRFIMTNYNIFITAWKEKAAIYHFHDLDFIPWALLLKMVTRSKIIYDIHEAHPEYMLIKAYLPLSIRKLMSHFIYALEHTAIKFFDAIIPNDNFISAGFKHKNNVVIFNFPTLDFFKDSNGLKWGSRKYDLFYHGSLPKYHFNTMMKIAEKLNSTNVNNLWGIITNDKAIIDWAKRELKSKGLEKNFDFLDYTDYLNIYRYLSNAKIGIIPLPPYKKFMKNIPLKMFEFMGCGMPMVLSDLPPSRQFIQNKNCAIAVEPDNINEYTNAISELLNDPAKAEAMGKNGKELVYGQFNWDIEEKKLLNLYKKLMSDTA